MRVHWFFALWLCLEPFAFQGWIDPGPIQSLKGSQRGILSSRDPRWIGGDGAISVDMGEGVALWLFGDTWIEHERGSFALVSNSLGIQENGCSDSFSPYWSKGPKAAFPTDQADTWLWPSGGFVEQDGLFLLFHVMERVGHSQWDFRVNGSELFMISNPRSPPTQWAFKRAVIPWAKEELLPGCSPLIENSHILFFATRPSGGSRELIVIRKERSAISQLKLETGWEFLAGPNKWSQNPNEAMVLFGGLGTEFSIAKEEKEGKWLCVYSPGGISEKIVFRTASRLEGPWGEEKLLYICPEAGSPQLYCYGAKHHAKCSDGGLWITYSVNSRDGFFPGKEVAKPRWVWLPHPLRRR